jgi:hypothetical protein
VNAVWRGDDDKHNVDDDDDGNIDVDEVGVTLECQWKGMMNSDREIDSDDSGNLNERAMVKEQLEIVDRKTAIV